MILTETIELDVLPEGLRLNAITLTLEVEFSYNPGQSASLDIWPPEPAEPASIEIVAMRVKKPAPKSSEPGSPTEWERAPGCFDEMVEIILLDRMGAGGW